MCSTVTGPGCSCGMHRRDFLKTVGAMTASVSMGACELVGTNTNPEVRTREKGMEPLGRVLGAFVYPSSELLKKEGYYSWPGSTFDAEERQKKYASKIQDIAQHLNMRIDMNGKNLDTNDDVATFIQEVERSKPDGLLLIPFKKGHWDRVVKIVDETQTPTVILATMGILLMPHIRQLNERPGVFMINSLDNLEAVQEGMRMIRTARWMKESRIVNINGSSTNEKTVPVIGTRVRTVPHQLFYDGFRNTGMSDEVKSLAGSFWKGSKKIIEPSEHDVSEAAKTYFVLKGIIESQKAEALMMNCLPGLKRPHKHVPPCMGYMKLRDEGIAMGCESDLNATLTMMLLQQLFGKPAFQHNPSADTEKNLYFGAHCTSASRMAGVNGPSEPVILRNHAEAGWGCVPRVLFKKGQEVTIAKYLAVQEPDGKPQMLVYSGEIIECPPIPPTGGCRTNFMSTINELEDVTGVQNHHLCMIYGNHAKQLRRFCQLHDIEVMV